MSTTDRQRRHAALWEAIGTCDDLARCLRRVHAMEVRAKDEREAIEKAVGRINAATAELLNIEEQ